MLAVLKKFASPFCALTALRRAISIHIFDADSVAQTTRGIDFVLDGRHGVDLCRLH